MGSGTENQYTPDEVSAPGETLAELLAERQMTELDLAESSGLPLATIRGLMAGREPLSESVAVALQAALGVPASFWSRRGATYRACLERAGTAAEPAVTGSA